MAKFEKITKYKEDADLAMPTRKTELSAGYDMVAAEDCVIPSIWTLMEDAKNRFEIEEDEYITTSMMAEFTKATGIKPTLVPTGMKCQLEPGTFLQLSVRSSSPLKYWIMMANGVGIIDADYFDNPGNEGHIFFQLYNLSPFNIQIKKGEAIGQGIIIPYATTENDNADGERVGGFGSTGK
jgi:dUTP pyrophosphatase